MPTKLSMANNKGLIQISDEGLPSFLFEEMTFHKQASALDVTIGNLSVLKVPKKKKDTAEEYFRGTVLFAPLGGRSVFIFFRTIFV
jgi:hypothetical protein